MTIQNFSFAAHAAKFDEHIGQSIPGLGFLSDHCLRLSPRFIQDCSTVLDVGCSTGRFLRAVSRFNHKKHEGVKYVGIDVESRFDNQWGRLRTENVDFRCQDARVLQGIEDTSLVYSRFTLQFLPERDKQRALQNIYNKMLPGGALIIAEKVLARSGRLQDALTFPYYDRKGRYFTAEEILDKERRLRGQMTLWSEDELKSKLVQVGFGDAQTIWTSFPFTAAIALKTV